MVNMETLRAQVEEKKAKLFRRRAMRAYGDSKGAISKALNKAIASIKPEVMLSRVAGCIQEYVEGHGYSVVKDYAGHGIGRCMHEEPQVPNYVSEELLANDVVLLSGTTLAIEPMICMGSGETEVMENKWTVVTKDRKLSTHFEHTVVVTDTGVEVLTVE